MRDPGLRIERQRTLAENGYAQTTRAVRREERLMAGAVDGLVGRAVERVEQIERACARTPRTAKLSQQRAGEEAVDAVFAAARIGRARGEKYRPAVGGQRGEIVIEALHPIRRVRSVDDEDAQPRTGRA